MTSLCLWLALFGADVEAIRKLPTEEECREELAFSWARVEDSLTQTTQLESEAKDAAARWLKVWYVVREYARETPRDELDPTVGRIVPLRPVSILERREALRALQ